METNLHILLLPAQEEANILDFRYQRELESIADNFRSHSQSTQAVQASGFAVFLTGEFVLKLSAAVGPVLGTAIGAWLHARYGRKVRIKVGDIETEAQTMEEVERLLARALEIQQRHPSSS
jgi:hypothetical protein